MIKKAIILAGGRGTRLLPATKITNKHLLPIYDRPMIYYPIETITKMGIEEILIICGNEHVGGFARLLGSGSEFGVKFTFRIQEGEGGIADALSLGEDFANKENVVVILGDNIFEDDFSSQAKNFKNGAHIFLKEASDPERFGVVEIEDEKVVSIEEKPKKPKSNLVATGIYFFDGSVFEKIKNISPSQRGELEIVDVEKQYMEEKNLNASRVSGNWTDAGTHESFFRATEIARKMRK